MSVHQAHNKSDYSLLQPQPNIGYVDHQSSSHMLFNSGVGVHYNNTIIPRKRGREISNSISMLPSHQFINLELLHNNTSTHSQHHRQQQNAVSTGLHLSCTDQQLNQNNKKQQSIFSSLFSENIENQIKQENHEIDHLIQSQGDLLRRVLADKRQKHYHALMTAREESVAATLRDREVETEKAKRRNYELESRAAQLGIEAQAWQSKIRAQEATAAALESQLQHAIATVNCTYMKDHISYCAVDGDNNNNKMHRREVEDAKSANVEPVQLITGPAVTTGPVCKGCWTRGATVVVLPCRHLCVCTDCDSGLKTCPVCLIVKSSSVEVRFY